MPQLDNIGQRIILVGTAGSGKSVLAHHLIDILHIPYIELDKLFWNPNWETVPNDVFEGRIREALAEAGNQWIVDGNYRGVEAITFPKATTLVWLDYPVYLIYFRVIKRTLRHIITGETFSHGNRETLKSAFWGKDAFIPWVIRTHHERRQLYLDLIASNPYPNLTIIRLQKPSEARRLLKQLSDSYSR